MKSIYIFIFDIMYGLCQIKNRNNCIFIGRGGLAFPVIVFYSLHGIVAVAALALVVYGSLSLKGIVS